MAQRIIVVRGTKLRYLGGARTKRIQPGEVGTFERYRRTELAAQVKFVDGRRAVIPLEMLEIEEIVLE